MSNTLNPFLSIIIPVYNLEDRITICLESIIHQTNNNFECIIINDGSTDNSLSVMEEYLIRTGNKSNFKIISTQNHGVGKARNEGIVKSIGNYIFFLDGDDFVSKDFVQTINFTVNNHPGIESIIFGYSTIDIQGETESYFDRYPRYYGEINGINVLKRIANKKTWVWTSNIVYTKKFIMDNNSLFRNYVAGQDIHFNYSNLLRINKVVLIDTELSHYFQRPGSITKSLNLRKFDAFYMRINLVEKLSGIENTPDKAILYVFFIRSLLVSFLQIYNLFLISGYNSKKLNDNLIDFYPNIMSDFQNYLKLYKGKDKFPIQIFNFTITYNLDRLYLFLLKIYSWITQKPIY